MMAGFLSLGWAARPASSSKKTAVKKSSTKSKTASKSTTKSAKSPAKTGKSTAKGTKSRTGARRASSSRRTPVRKAATWRSRQLAPTPERYKQIQDALVAKGYLQADQATGSWGPDSVDALKRFQADQKIDGSGKINSLSLIALGLGPKRENVAVSNPPVPPAGQ